MKYFTESEFCCKGDNDENIAEYGRGCGCGFSLPAGGISKDLMNLLDAVRERIGEPLIISCGYRCPVHNSDVGGVRNSQHLLGFAADVYANGIDVDELGDIVYEVMSETGLWGGIGRYYGMGFVHVDTRGEYAPFTG